MEGRLWGKISSSGDPKKMGDYHSYTGFFHNKKWQKVTMFIADKKLNLPHLNHICKNCEQNPLKMVCPMVTGLLSHKAVNRTIV
jgi:hypothetical protein